VETKSKTKGTFMKIRLIASAAFIALFGGSAIAADLAVKAPPPPPAPI
jgi:hypothetical protein